MRLEIYIRKQIPFFIKGSKDLRLFDKVLSVKPNDTQR
jgi:hypothetical protein